MDLVRVAGDWVRVMEVLCGAGDLNSGTLPTEPSP